MRSHSLARAVGLALLVVGPPAAGQPYRPAKDSDLLLRVNAPVTVAAAESASSVVVIRSDATVLGTVREQLIVMGGTARVTGTVEGGVAVFGGRLELGPNARVGRDVYLYRSTMSRSPGAAIAGTVETTRGPSFGQGFAIGFWLSLTLVVVAFGLLFAAVAGAPLARAAGTLAREPAAAAVGGILLWGLAPVAAIFSFATVIGIPLGVAILVFLLPALGFAGYVVAGTTLGAMLIGTPERLSAEVHPYRAVALGLVILQAVGFIPLVGALLVMLAGAAGAGALVYRAWTGLRGRPASRLVMAPAH